MNMNMRFPEIPWSIIEGVMERRRQATPQILLEKKLEYDKTIKAEVKIQNDPLFIKIVELEKYLESIEGVLRDIDRIEKNYEQRIARWKRETKKLRKQLKGD